MHVGAGGTVGQPERAWLPASPRVTRSAPMAWALRARAPVAAGSLPRATRSVPKAGALRARAPTCALRVTAHVVSWGEWGCRRRRALRAAREARCKACFELLPRARVGWHTTRTSVPPPPPRSSGAAVRWLMARGRRASGVAAAPRPRPREGDNQGRKLVRRLCRAGARLPDSSPRGYRAQAVSRGHRLVRSLAVGFRGWGWGCGAVNTVLCKCTGYCCLM